MVPNGGVAHLTRHVDREPLLHAPHVVGHADPLPGRPLLHRAERHPFDPGQHPHQVVAVLGLAGRDGEAAVAHHQRGHAMPEAGREQRVPQHLVVVVGVDVDDAGSDNLALGVDDALGLARHLAGLDDLAALHRHVAGKRRCAGAVDDRPVPNDEVVHEMAPPARRRGSFEPRIPRFARRCCSRCRGCLPRRRRPSAWRWPRESGATCLRHGDSRCPREAGSSR